MATVLVKRATKGPREGEVSPGGFFRQPRGGGEKKEAIFAEARAEGPSFFVLPSDKGRIAPRGPAGQTGPRSNPPLVGQGSD